MLPKSLIQLKKDLSSFLFIVKKVRMQQYRQKNIFLNCNWYLSSLHDTRFLSFKYITSYCSILKKTIKRSNSILSKIIILKIKNKFSLKCTIFVFFTIFVIRQYLTPFTTNLCVSDHFCRMHVLFLFILKYYRELNGTF